MRSFQTKQSVNKTNVSDGSSKQVTQQNLPQNRKQAEIHTNTLTPGMYRIATSTTQNREPQLPHASRNTNPHVTSNVNVVCAECGKCVFNSNHDACVSKHFNDVNARTKKPKVVPISASKPKRKMNKSVATTHKKIVASDTTIQKPKSYFKELYENTNKAWKWWIEKKCPLEYKWTQTTPSRPSLKWKPTGRIFSNVRLRWVPTGKLFNYCTGKVDSEPTHGSIVDIPHIHACKQTLGLSAGLVPQGQKASDYDNSDPFAPKTNVVPTAEKTDSSQKEEGIDFEIISLVARLGLSSDFHCHAAHKSFPSYQMDWKMTFLNCTLKEEGLVARQ
ncbi:hypothetical protein Tco_0533284 [Tanacetum coccineum]